MEKQRFVKIDIMVGLAMTLVILGHQLFTFMPDWYRTMHYYIYSFHMPLFVFLSGFLVRYTYREVCTGGDYLSYLKRKASKFVPYYLLIGFVCMSLGALQEQSLSEMGREMLNLLVNPYESEARFLWYIYLLMIYYALSPWLFRLPDALLLAVGICCYAVSVMVALPNVLCLAYFMRFTLFFVLGAMCARYVAIIRCPIFRAFSVGGAVAFMSLSLYTLFISPGYHPIIEIALAFSSIPFFYVLASSLAHIRPINALLTHVSKNCYGVYLWHLPLLWAIALIIEFFLVKASPVLGIIILLVNLIVAIAVSIPVHRQVAKYFDRWFQ